MFIPILSLYYLFFILKNIHALNLKPAQSLPAQVPSSPEDALLNASFLVPPRPTLDLPSNLSALMVDCDAARYGNNLRYASCYDACRRIPHFVDSISFGPKTQGKWKVLLPFRIFSCESPLQPVTFLQHGSPSPQRLYQHTNSLSLLLTPRPS